MTKSLALTKDMPQATNKAMPYTIIDGKLLQVPFASTDNLAPSGAISSSVNDLSKWMIAHLNDGKYQGKKIIPSAAITATRTLHSILGKGRFVFNKGLFSLYGLGFFVYDYEGRQIVSHEGYMTGFVSRLTFFPEEKLGVVVLTNIDQNGFHNVL